MTQKSSGKIAPFALRHLLDRRHAFSSAAVLRYVRNFQATSTEHIDLCKMVKLFLSTPWRHTAVVEVSLYPFLTSALDGGELSTPRAVRVTPGKEPGYPLSSKVAGPQNGSGRFWRTFVHRLLRIAYHPRSRRLRSGRTTRTVKPWCVNTLWGKKWC